MAELHRLIELQGIDQTRALAADKQERAVVDAAFRLMSGDDPSLALVHAGFALTCLPYRLYPATVWRREGAGATMLVESGYDANGNPIGVPYGAKARMILCYLQTEAIRKNSRRVEMGGSMRAFMRRMGMSVGGATYRVVGEQTRRICSARLTFVWRMDRAERRVNGAFVRDSLLFFDEEDRQEKFWQEEVELDEGFYESLRKHSVPLQEVALRAIADNSLAIDIYVWLAYRLHVLDRNTKVPWPALMGQFGAGFGLMKNFRPCFLRALKLALAVYPEAVVAPTDGGIMLAPSPPPVPHRLPST